MKRLNLSIDSTMFATVSCGAIVAILLTTLFLAGDTLPISTQVVTSRYVTVAALVSAAFAVQCDRRIHCRSMLLSSKALEKTYATIAYKFEQDRDDFAAWQDAVRNEDISTQIEIEEKVRERR